MKIPLRKNKLISKSVSIQLALHVHSREISQKPVTQFTRRQSSRLEYRTSRQEDDNWPNTIMRKLIYQGNSIYLFFSPWPVPLSAHNLKVLFCGCGSNKNTVCSVCRKCKNEDWKMNKIWRRGKWRAGDGGNEYEMVERVGELVTKRQKQKEGNRKRERRR